MISIAVQAIHSLMILNTEEHLLRQYQFSHIGWLLPRLKPHQLEGLAGSKQEEIEDGVILQKDLVKVSCLIAHHFGWKQVSKF
jgi:hypothetical protein